MDTNIENGEIDWVKVCEDVIAANPALDGAPLFDAMAAALASAGVKVDAEGTALLRANYPNGVAVVDLGDGEWNLIENWQGSFFDMCQYSPSDQFCELVSEDTVTDMCSGYFDNPLTVEDLAALRYVLRDGVKYYDSDDVDSIHGNKERAQKARFAEQRTVTFDLPDEFLLLCEQYGLTPVQALRGFVADVCSIENYVANPREDGYNSHGSDERDMARAYFDRAHF